MRDNELEARGRASPWHPIIFKCGLFVFFCAVAGGWGVKAWHEHQNLEHLKHLHSEGRVTTAEVVAVEVRDRSKLASHVAVEYNGPSGSAVASLDLTESSARGAEVGQRLDVIYDPAEPAKVWHVDELHGDRVVASVGGVCFFVLLAIPMLVLVVEDRRNLRRSAPQHQSIGAAAVDRPPGHRPDPFRRTIGPWPADVADAAEREEVRARLRDACAQGRLTLEELIERTDQVAAAATRGELARLTDDLPAGAAPPPGWPYWLAPPAPTKGVVVAILNNITRDGYWWPNDPLIAAALGGHLTLDLRKAHLPAAGLTIRAAATLGSITVLVPQGLRTELSGTTVHGNAVLDVAPVPATAPVPVVRVQAHGAWGDVHVVNAARPGFLGRHWGYG